MEDVINLLDQGLSQYRPPVDGLDQIWELFSTQDNMRSVVAILDDEVVGYGSMLIETKIRGGRAGHIEDIVARADLRGQGIGKAIVDELSRTAEEAGCYKVILQCRESNVDFYRKRGYEISGQAMQRF